MGSRVVISPDDVIGWFKAAFQRQRIPLTPIIAASISGRLEVISGIRPRETVIVEFKAADHLRGLKKHLPEVIEHFRSVAKQQDILNAEPGVSGEWFYVRDLEDLAASLERAEALLRKPAARPAWHIRAAQIEDIIVSAFAIHAGRAEFGRSADKPLIKVIAMALQKIDGKIHGESAIADAIAHVPLRDRLVIVSPKLTADRGWRPRHPKN